MTNVSNARLKGKVALISGGARGMGAEEARLFAQEGAKVVIGDVLEQEGRKTEAEINETGGEALFVRLDVTQEESWRGAVEAAVARFGTLNVLVNNAGIGGVRSGEGPMLLEDAAVEDWDRVMDVNAKGVFLGTKHVIPAMRAAGGVAVHLADVALHAVVEQNTWLEANSWVIGAGILMLAGVYQFTPLKYQCLDKCRSPMSFIAGHWTGRHEQAQAFRLGVDHGIFCVGFCWSMMLLMFAVGAGSVGWMLVLGTLMAIEKNMPWGRRFSKPLGVVLLTSGVVIASGVRSWPL